MRRTLEDSLLRSSARLVTEISAGHIRLGVGSPAVDPARDQSVVQVMSSLGRLQFTTVRAGTSSLLTARQRDHAAAARIFVQSVRPGWRNPRLVLAEPVPGEKGYLLAVGASLDELDNAMSRLEDLLAIGGTAFVVLASLGGLVLAGRALRPVERLRQEAAQLSASLPEHRLAVPRTHDEVARLAVTLNSLLDRLQKALSREREFHRGGQPRAAHSPGRPPGRARYSATTRSEQRGARALARGSRPESRTAQRVGRRAPPTGQGR
jgi:two-component system OmpR family sensor kinase